MWLSVARGTDLIVAQCCKRDRLDCGLVLEDKLLLSDYGSVLGNRFLSGDCGSVLGDRLLLTDCGSVLQEGPT